MFGYIKKIIKKIFNLLGLEISKKSFKEDECIYPQISTEESGLYRMLYSEESIENRRFYNIGAGSFFHPYWTNIDYHNDFYDQNQHIVNIEYDLMKKEQLPLPDKCAEIIYISHVLEHITDAAAKNILSECYRILKPKGLLRIVQPDIDYYYDAYKREDCVFFGKYPKTIETKLWEEQWFGVPMNVLEKASLEDMFLLYCFRSLSPIVSDNHLKIVSSEFKRLMDSNDYINTLNYFSSLCSFDYNHPEYHINWFNKNKLIDVLRSSNFEHIIPSAYGKSISPILRNTVLFDTTVPEVSLYIEAIK
ncbi:methyltransferase domain-containing protein [Treponema sp. OMZ 792]|uniref:class I SAM-dependent methyltransferase n=1 Tax=unclassified Treponema TaxID=2638727 RepID=UPI0020A258FE|nr:MULTISPECIES: methyltransferase domain-containing protein [unclassified Treponema]UTC76295.1 methyltransferase domain-containing protein [Treponema sp. OMZ 792]UTC80300.1 methyltransferase domain-containing protein [Treponema sp. OMZ 798]